MFQVFSMKKVIEVRYVRKTRNPFEEKTQNEERFESKVRVNSADTTLKLDFFKGSDSLHLRNE